MKLNLHLLKRTFLQIITILFLSVSGIFLFQGQNYNDTKSSDENSSVTDRWWISADNIQINIKPPQPMTVVTTPDGFDNFNMGNDAAESSIATNPNNPAWFMSAFNGIPFATQYGHHTENAYDPFANTPIPYPGSLGDPWVVYDSLGNLFTITLNSGPTGTWVLKSTDNGATWGSAVAGCVGGDRENICADQTGGPYANYIYCGETNGASCSFYRSTDHGASFQSMTSLSPHQLPGFMIAVGPNGGIQGGCVYAVTYTYTGSFFPQTYNFHRSTNGGQTWQTSISTITGIGFSGIDGGSGRGSINGMRTRAYPMIAADNSYGPYRGRFYCCWANNPGGTSGGHPDIYLKYSTDLGSTWSSTITVNDNPGTASDDWFPAIWCDKADGKLYIKWYSDQENPSSFQTAVYAAYSTTGGTTFTPSTRISNQSFPYPNVGPCSNCVTNYRGDYDGIISNGYTSMSAWFDGRNASYGSFSGYFPDFAMTVNPAILNVTNQNDSNFAYISIPAVKLFTDKAKFTQTVTPTPGTGTLTVNFLKRGTNILQDSLTSYPDSLRLRVKATGGVTSNIYTITITAKGTNGTPMHVRTIQLNVYPVGLISNSNEIPKHFSLYQNYPNPFNPTTNIRFDIVKTGLVKLIVYDITGKVVSSLIDKEYDPGKYSYELNASSYASGIYFYKLEAPGFTDMKKMILIK